MRAKEIIPGLLYMGSTPSKWKPREKRDEWLREHVKHVVALCRRDPDVDIEGINVVHAPLVDSHVGVDERIPEHIVPWVLDRVRAGEPVLVSCLAGRSRSGITCGLVLREYYRVTGEEALRILRERRPNAIKREKPADWLRSLGAPE